MIRLFNVSAWLVCRTSFVVVTTALAAGLALPAIAVAQSQATTGEINERVTDAQGGVLPGVTVTAKSPQTGYIRTVRPTPRACSCCRCCRPTPTISRWSSPGSVR